MSNTILNRGRSIIPIGLWVIMDKKIRTYFTAWFKGDL